jgi:hypothetical protein
VTDTPLPRCGDTVYHRPSKETWEVAYAHAGYLSWFGWPEGQARVEDCDLTKRCTDEEHEKAVAQWLDKPHGSNGESSGSINLRVDMVRRLYRPAEAARLDEQHRVQLISDSIESLSRLGVGDSSLSALVKHLEDRRAQLAASFAVPEGKPKS